MTQDKEIGLFFGSFNPIHIGHMILANYMVEFTNMDELWFVVSPQNPFKDKSSLLDDIHRYAMVDRVVEDDDRFKASNIEFSLPKPSYTVDTLAYLQEKYPSKKFSLIMGEDNLTSLHKWKNADWLVENHKIYVYPRPKTQEGKFDNHPNILKVEAPQIEISASFLRNSIKEGKDIQYYMPQKAWDYCKEMNFYR